MLGVFLFVLLGRAARACFTLGARAGHKIRRRSDRREKSRCVRRTLCPCTNNGMRAPNKRCTWLRRGEPCAQQMRSMFMYIHERI